MTSGDLDANGEIDGDIVMSSGKVNLGPTAIVHGDIRGTSGNVNQAEGSRVEGQILEQSGFTIGPRQILGLLLRCCLLPLLLLGLPILLLVFFFRRRRAAPSPAAPPDQGETPATPAPAPASSEDPKQKLKQLKEMLDEGLVTEAEYEAKKTEILAGM
jgi:hypothetical protein